MIVLVSPIKGYQVGLSNTIDLYTLPKKKTPCPPLAGSTLGSKVAKAQ